MRTKSAGRASIWPRSGLIDTGNAACGFSPRRGARRTSPTERASVLFKSIHDGFQRRDDNPAKQIPKKTVDEADASAPDEKVYLNQDAIKKSLCASCAASRTRALRIVLNYGTCAENLKVTGQTGDHGIDGEGLPAHQPVCPHQVMFQCKRYAGTVRVKEIRDFRGAIRTRRTRHLPDRRNLHEKRPRGSRRNATAIELVDIDRLLELLIEEGLGVRETKALTIDRDFFSPYQKAL